MKYYATGIQSKGDTTLYNNKVTFDTDSGPIGVDEKFSGCIFHLIKCFKGQVIDYNKVIKWFGGKITTNIKNVTIVWKWLDYDRREQIFNVHRY